MSAVFGQAWKERLIEGDADAVLKLTDHVLDRLYATCFQALGNQELSEKVVRSTLLGAVRNARDYSPSAHESDVWQWVLDRASRELRRCTGTDHSIPAGNLNDAEEPSAAVRPDATFVYQVQANLCVEAHRRNDPPEGRDFQAKSKEMSIACPDCGSTFRVSETRIGRQARCGRCGTLFQPRSDTGPSPARQEVAPGTWYVRQNDEIKGPFTTQQVRKWISLGRLDATSPVRHVDSDHWETAGQAAGLLPKPPGASRGDPESPPLEATLPPRASSDHAGPTQGERPMPRQIGRFEIREWVGSGAFGDVYRAYDPVLDRELALKVATSAALDNDHVRPYVLREPKAAARLRHPHIVAVHDAGFDDAQFYVAIDFISGCTLRERLASSNVAPGEAVQLVISLAHALDYAHRMKVLHRDVKPGNIMIDQHGQALLMDFGLARVEHKADDRIEEGFFGTPGYMPPEQINRDLGKPGPHSDQYSLGVVLFELLCGGPPFEGPQSVVVHNTLHSPPPPLREVNKTIAADLEAICLKTLAKKPSERYGSCAELADDLRRYRESRATIARPLPFRERVVRWCRREPALSLAIAACTSLLVLLVLSLAVTAVVQSSMNEELTKKHSEAQAARDDAERQSDRAVAAREDAESQRRKAVDNEQLAVKRQAVAFFRHGHTLCEDGHVPQGLVYLVESLQLADRAGEPEWASTIRLGLSAWRRELHDLQAMLPHHVYDQDWPAHCVAIDPEGRMATSVTRTDEGGSLLWFWDLSRKIPSLLGDPVVTDESIRNVVFGAGGRLATIGTIDGNANSIIQVRLRQNDSVPTSVWRTQVEGHVRAIAFTGASKFATAKVSGATAFLEEWGWTNFACTVIRSSPLSVQPTCLAYCPKQQRLALGAADTNSETGSVLVYDCRKLDFKSAEWVRSTKGMVFDVAFSHDGLLLAAAIGGTLKGSAQVYNAQTGSPDGERLDHLSVVYAVDFSPDDRMILTSSQDRTVRLWDCFSGRQLSHPMWHNRDVRDITFLPATDEAPHRLSCFSVSDDGIGRLWNIARGTPARSAQLEPGLRAGARLPGTDQLVVVGQRRLTAGDTRIFDTTNFPLRETGRIRQDRPCTAVAAGSESWGIVGRRDGQTLIVDWDTLKTRPTGHRHDGMVLCAAISADAQFVATGGEDGKVWLWSTRDTREIQSLYCGGKVYAVAFDPSPDSPILLTAGTPGKVVFWHRETGDRIGQKLDHSDAILCATYTDDGTMLAVGFAGGAQIWLRNEAGGWVKGARMEAETGILRSVVWPKQGLLATGDLHGNVRFWHLATGEPIGPALANQGLVSMLVPSEDDYVLSATTSGSVRRWPLPVATPEPAKILRSWVASVTGVRMGAQQVIERINQEEWYAESSKLAASNGKMTLIDRRIDRDRAEYADVIPRLGPTEGETPTQLSLIQSIVRSFFNETPTFQPLSLDYMEGYLPGDTEALVGIDVRQLISAPIVYEAIMPYASGLSKALGVWMASVDQSGLNPLSDIEYVLVAAPRASAKKRSLESFLRSLTLVVKGDFDSERLWATAKSWAERLPELSLGEGSGDTRIRVLNRHDEPLTFAALVEDEEGGTLIASGVLENVQRAIRSPNENQLDPGFGDALGAFDSNNSVWFVIRREVADLDDKDVAALMGALPLATIEMIEGHFTAFVQLDFSVRTTFADADSAKQMADMITGVSTGITAGRPSVRMHTGVNGRATTTHGVVPPDVLRQGLTIFEGAGPAGPPPPVKHTYKTVGTTERGDTLIVTVRLGSTGGVYPHADKLREVWQTVKDGLHPHRPLAVHFYLQGMSPTKQRPGAIVKEDAKGRVSVWLDGEKRP